MREIKFRLRGRGNEIVGFEKWYTGSWSSKGLWTAKPQWLYSQIGDCWNPNIIDHCNKDQYTGLKDKNGKDIYEGDILRFNETGYEDFDKGQVVYCADKNYPAFDLEPRIDCDSNGLSYIMGCCECEIIGNIYQNPELLKGGN